MGLQLAGLLVMLTLACAAAKPPPQDAVRPPQTDGHDEAVAKRLADLERLVGAQAVEILRLQLRIARLENNDALQMEILQNGLASPVVDVQVAVIREIGVLSPDKLQKFLPTLRQIVTRGSAAAAQVQAVDILSRFPEEEGLMLQAAGSGSADVRRAAAVGLRGFASEAGFGALQRLTSDADQSVRLAAIDGIGLSKHAKAADALMQIAREGAGDAELERAIQALGRKKIPAAFDIFKDRLSHKSETIRWACVHSLGELGDPRAVEFVRPLIAEDQTKTIREISIEVLGRLKDKPSVPALTKLLRADGDERLRSAACRAIGAIGAPEALEDLLAALVADRVEAVSQSAWEALQKISVDSLALEEKLVKGLIDRKRKAEIDFMLARIHKTRTLPEQKPDVRRIEILVAEFLMAEKDFKVALDYWKTLSADGDYPHGAYQLALCYREVGDWDGSVKLLKELLGKFKPDSAEWLSTKIELTRTLARKDPKACIEETFPMLASPALSAEARRELEPIQEQAVRAIALQLTLPDQKAAAQETLKGLGKKALGPVLSMIQRPGAQDAPALVEAGNAITGTTYPSTIVQDKEKFEIALKTWTAFLKN